MTDADDMDKLRRRISAAQTRALEHVKISDFGWVLNSGKMVLWSEATEKEREEIRQTFATIGEDEA